MYLKFKKIQSTILSNKLVNWKIENHTQRYLGIIFIILSLILFYNYNYKYKNYKNITEVKEFFNTPTYKTLISHWDNGSGFYSVLAFKLNHYLFCKKYNINYKTTSHNWPYKFKNGWTDYFQDVELKLNEDNKDNKDNGSENSGEIHQENGCCTILEQFKLKDYVDIIPEYYKYTPEVQSIINNKKNELGLVNGEYGSIYIRRGDKLIDEINFVHTDKFIDKLLLKYPECKTIFLQTDDYNSFIDLQNYIKNNNLNIRPITLCPENMFGSIAHNGWMDKMKNNSYANKEYLETIKSNLSKPISEMTPEEKYAHTIELITSVDICINSKYCVCDYKSNVSRFIKVAHKNVMNVFDVLNGDTLFDLESYKTIGFDFDSVHNQ
jgi:hypothetical protein